MSQQEQGSRQCSSSHLARRVINRQWQGCIKWSPPPVSLAWRNVKLSFCTLNYFIQLDKQTGRFCSRLLCFLSMSEFWLGDFLHLNRFCGWLPKQQQKELLKRGGWLRFRLENQDLEMCACRGCFWVFLALFFKFLTTTTFSKSHLSPRNIVCPKLKDTILNTRFPQVSTTAHGLHPFSWLSCSNCLYVSMVL